MNEEAKELRAFIRSNEAGEVAVSRAMAKYVEWGGGFDEELLRSCLRAGVLAASKAYAAAHAHPGDEATMFPVATRNQVIDGIFEEVKERYSSSEVATNFFLTLQTDGKFYSDGVTPLMLKLRGAAAVGAFSLQGAQKEMSNLIRGHVAAFEALMRRQEEPCEVLAVDLEQVTREMTDCYLTEFKVCEAAASAVDLDQPMTLGVEQANGDYAVLATFNNQNGTVVAPEAFQSLVGEFVSKLHESGVASRVVLVNREDAPSTLDEFAFQHAPADDTPGPDF